MRKAFIILIIFVILSVGSTFAREYNYQSFYRLYKAGNKEKINTAIDKGPYLLLKRNSIIYENPGTKFEKVSKANKDDKLLIIGMTNDFQWIKVFNDVDGISGWISGNNKYTEYELNHYDIPLGTYRPHSEILKKIEYIGSLSELRINNHFKKDIVIVVTDINKKICYVAYIRAMERKESSFKIQNIKPGRYYLFYKAGTDWNGEDFVNCDVKQKFDIPFEFGKNNIWTITLNPLLGGNTSASPVSESQFPNL